MSSCRILVISIKSALGLAFAERVKALTLDISDTTRTADLAGDYEAVSTSTEDGLHILPWALKNKYYSADVHFAVVDVAEWRLRHVVGVPAIIFVWATGEPFKSTLQHISDDLSKSAIDPEVSLAVQVASANGRAVAASRDQQNKENSSEDSSEDSHDHLDEFISSCGFEYIDGTTAERADDSDIPTLPRVLDALSTIMWPSMVQSHSLSTNRRQSRSANLLNLDLMDEGGLAALLSAARAGSQADDAGVVELEQWLEDDESEDGVGPYGGEDMKTPDVRNTGFEDDFAAFVSAPASSSAPGNAHHTSTTGADAWLSTTTPTIPSFSITSTTPSSSTAPLPDFRIYSDTSFGSTYDFDSHSPVSTSRDTLREEVVESDGDNWASKRLTPMHTGASWNSLRSVSEISDAEGHLYSDRYTPLPDEENQARADIEEGEDPELPSKAEIRATSARIFGPGLAPPSATNPSGTARSTGPSSNVDSEDSLAQLGLQEEADQNDPSFDLTNVLASLEGMKAEIAAMPDEDARRRAAARVALGLVYGLGLEEND